MPPLQTKIEGRGSGIKTVLINVRDVAKDLLTEPLYATKFLGMEVGMLSQYNHRRKVGIMYGVHQTKDLQVILQKFIREFILCPKCKLPELQFKVRQKRNILLQKCTSCGWKGTNGSTHKVKTYIINHPPYWKRKADKRKKKAKQRADEALKNHQITELKDIKVDQPSSPFPLAISASTTTNANAISTTAQLRYKCFYNFLLSFFSSLYN
eukprot:550714_1